MNDLLLNIDKIHTTKLGFDRISKNLNLINIDVVKYLKEIILNKNDIIYKKGKNWYCEYGDIIITINARSYTIITAHKQNIELGCFLDNLETYKLMYKWCKQEFIYEWFEQRILTLDEIKRKYKGKLKEAKQELHIIYYNNKKIGFVQIYKYEDTLFKELKNYKNIYEYDIFIGEEKYLSKGIGTKIVNYVDNYIYNTFNADAIILRPFSRNIRAINCYLKCNYEKILQYEGKDTLNNKEMITVLKKVCYNDARR